MMIDFLKKVNITDETIDQMFEKNLDSLLQDIDNNEENYIKIILFLKKIDIKNINDLLIYKPSIFKGSFTDFIKEFKKYDANKLVDLINSDYNNIDLIWQ